MIRVSLMARQSFTVTLWIFNVVCYLRFSDDYAEHEHHEHEALQTDQKGADSPVESLTTALIEQQSGVSETEQHRLDVIKTFITDESSSNKLQCPSGYTFSHNGYWTGWMPLVQFPLSNGMQLCAQRCANQPGCIALDYMESSQGFCYIYTNTGTVRSHNSIIACRRNPSTPAPTLSENFPAGLMAAGAVLETAQSARTTAKYTAISNAVAQLVNALPTTCNNDACPRGEFVGCVVRMAGHDFMDFNGNDFGGSDGCIDFTDPDNAGLRPCLVDGENGQNLNSAFSQFSNEVSLADFLVIAAEALMVRQRGTSTPAINFASGFTWGRRTRTECPVSHTGPNLQQQLLPNPDNSCAANEVTFVQNLGLTWRETAALMGVHTLGRARKTVSGFDGWWSDAVSQQSFNNNFYISIMLKGWGPQTVPESGKMQWRRVGNFSSSNSHEMMLNTDLCLAYADNNGQDLKSATAASNNCCAWVMPSVFTSAQYSTALAKNTEGSRFCGFNSPQPSTCEFCVRHWCCSMGSFTTGSADCNNIASPGGKAAADVIDFAANEGTWLEVFLVAWRRATRVIPTSASLAEQHPGEGDDAPGQHGKHKQHPGEDR